MKLMGIQPLMIPTAGSPDTSSGSFNDYNSYWVDYSGKVTEHSGSHVDIVGWSYGRLSGIR